MTKKYFTTPIYYVNDVPHIGTAYTTLAADTLSRYWRAQGADVHFLTGTDENSQKTIDAAAKAEMPVEAYLEDMAGNFHTTWKALNIVPDDFIRTTEPRHHDGVTHILKKIAEKNPDDIYKGEYVGKYCSRCETFLKESELIDGKCPDHKTVPEEISETNYFFRLTKYAEPLLELLSRNDFLRPESRRNEMIAFIKDGLEDISITREGASIGIPYYADPAHKLYVWAEAVMNYYSALMTPTDKTAFWPEAVHIVGKDITRFHAIIWPALLMSAGMPLPKAVFAHGFFTIDGTKMSKSLGNVIHPTDLAETYGADAVRIGLLSAFTFGGDGDFSADGMKSLYTTRLAGGVGNLFNRVVKLAEKKTNGAMPPLNEMVDFIAPFDAAMNDMRLWDACEALFAAVNAANERLNQTEIWKVKDDETLVNNTFGYLFEVLRQITTMSKSLLPDAAIKMKAMLGDGNTCGTAVILFPRLP